MVSDSKVYSTTKLSSIRAIKAQDPVLWLLTFIKIMKNSGRHIGVGLFSLKV